jgi:ribosomal protein S6
MQKYELLYILPTKYTDEEIGGVISKLTEEMKASGVNIVRAEQAGKLKLAYPIRHQRYGYYVIAAIEAEFEELKKLQTYLKMNLEILRSAIYKAASGKAATAAVALKELGDITPESRPTVVKERKFVPPVQAPAPAADKPKMSMEELDKKLDQILEGDIV